MLEKLYELYKRSVSVQTDTRKLKSGDMFFALKGPSFNGNLFARQALEMGASVVVVDEEIGIEDDRIFVTDDVLTTLQHLAGYHRQQFSIPFIGITGSNGKTTTKELVHAVLSKKYKTYTTQGNLNNHIGIPLTLLSVKSDAEMAIIEMGANHLQEIAGYCIYTAPTHGMITNCGKAHLEGFGSEEGVRKGKGELYDYLRGHSGLAFVMKDYEYLLKMSNGISSFTYGSEGADVTGRMLRNNPFIVVALEVKASEETIEVETQLVGDYNLPNILAAAAIGSYFGVDAKSIKAAIEEYSPSNSRSQLIKKENNNIILDAYNANPSSMAAALDNFSKLPGENKSLVLGAMMELGSDSILEHTQLVKLIEQDTWSQVILVGGDFGKIKQPYMYFETAELAAKWLSNNIVVGATYLIKGSRSTKMETILNAF